MEETVRTIRHPLTRCNISVVKIRIFPRATALMRRQPRHRCGWRAVFRFQHRAPLVAQQLDRAHLPPRQHAVYEPYVDSGRDSRRFDHLQRRPVRVARQRRHRRDAQPSPARNERERQIQAERLNHDVERQPRRAKRAAERRAPSASRSRPDLAPADSARACRATAALAAAQIRAPRRARSAACRGSGLDSRGRRSCWTGGARRGERRVRRPVGAAPVGGLQ